uniref:Uncharacterized protein n=1 Tax=Glycine max TaxID=3847 RepID=K7KA50_SOYBN
MIPKDGPQLCHFQLDVWTCSPHTHSAFSALFFLPQCCTGCWSPLVPFFHFFNRFLLLVIAMIFFQWGKMGKNKEKGH